MMLLYLPIKKFYFINFLSKPRLEFINYASIDMPWVKNRQVNNCCK